VDAAKAAAAGAEQHTEVAHTDNDRVQALKNYTNVVAHWTRDRVALRGYWRADSERDQLQRTGHTDREAL